MNEKHSEEMEILLDRAVEHYRAAEPRPGLEQRILAGLQSAPAPALGWHWKGVLTTATVLLTAITLYWALRSPSADQSSPERPRIARTEPAETSAPPEPSALPASTKPAAPAPRLAARRDPRAGQPTKVMVAEAAAPPRRATFPSPRTLSPQEILLVRFLQAAPREVMATVALPPQPLAVAKLPEQKITIEPLPGFIALNPEQENTQGE